MLGFGLDDEEYRQALQREIKGSQQFSKCFVQLITYESFANIAH